ncbi:squalene synthase-like [Watersipora subatra]|uniref:squalene synthase-like n=1 Tax=Watersipora subatra TaxID=2589382 RepID=UPI00355BA4E1
MELLRSAGHPEEVLALLRFKLGKNSVVRPRCSLSEMPVSMKRCYEYLNMTSRSFAAVIQALDSELRNAVCVFYLVLRALDTVEDDMSIPIEKKVPMLKSFHTNLYNADWTFLKSQEKDKIVLEDFLTISHEFRMLKKEYQEIIAEITEKMGLGMTVFFSRELETDEDWDEYCHYVAGLVGIGLSKLFSASGLEGPVVGRDTGMANSMGLFLQKTNIIRDYLEDITDGRVFWPKSVWRKYASESLSEFRSMENSREAVHCLNDLVANALTHVPDAIEYMSRIQNQSVFNFCAIPQVMAIATLEKLYNNVKVFGGVVKIRKGTAVRLMGTSSDIDKVKAIFSHFLLKIQAKVSQTDPSRDRTLAAVKAGLECTKTHTVYNTTEVYVPLYMSVLLMLSAIIWHYWNTFNLMLE